MNIATPAIGRVDGEYGENLYTIFEYRGLDTINIIASALSPNIQSANNVTFR